MSLPTHARSIWFDHRSRLTPHHLTLRGWLQNPPPPCVRLQFFPPPPPSLPVRNRNLTESMPSFRLARPNHLGAEAHYFIVRLNHFPAISSLIDARRVLLRGQFRYKLEGPYYGEKGPHVGRNSFAQLRFARRNGRGFFAVKNFIGRHWK